MTGHEGRLHRARACGIATLLAALSLTACASPTPPSASPASRSPVASPTPTADFPSQSPVPTPATPSPSPAERDLAATPFTVLVLGRDSEDRTDVVMVVGIDPAKRAITLASIPRDTIDVPLPLGGVFRDQKINAFYNTARQDPSRYPAGPGRATADLVEGMLDVRIDYYASTTFGGFTKIVNAMRGVRITLPKAIADPHYQVTSTNIGIRFPAGDQVLNGLRSLIYVRTRYADNDFERQRRQQRFLVAAGTQLVGRPETLGALLAAGANLQTDFPLDQLARLISLAEAPEWSVRGAVLGPQRYESAASCPCGYALKPNLPAMRELAAEYFPWAVLP